MVSVVCEVSQHRCCLQTTVLGKCACWTLKYTECFGERICHITWQFLSHQEEHEDLLSTYKVEKIKKNAWKVQKNAYFNQTVQNMQFFRVNPCFQKNNNRQMIIIMTVSFKLRGIGRFIKHIQGWKKNKKKLDKMHGKFKREFYQTVQNMHNFSG